MSIMPSPSPKLVTSFPPLNAWEWFEKMRSLLPRPYGRLEAIPPMRMVLFVAIAANSLDLIATALGIHWRGNREGNPLLAGLAHNHWWLFVVIKGVVVPLLILKLYHYRNSTPWLANAGMAIITVALTVALGQWLGWMAGVIRVATLGL
jgi:hypothetical protein